MAEHELCTFFTKAERMLEQRPIRAKDYLLLCEEGIELGKKYPQMRSTIGSYLTSAGAYLRFADIADIAPNLEYPSSDKGWAAMEHLVEDTMKELSKDFHT